VIGSENQNELGLDNVAGIRKRTQTGRTAAGRKTKFEIRNPKESTTWGGQRSREEMGGARRAENMGTSTSTSRTQDDDVRSSHWSGGGTLPLGKDEFFLLLATGSGFVQIILVERAFVVGCPISILDQPASFNR
jgi:hypothetical protein